MSLSFVSKSVQTTTEDGGFVEEAIAGASTENETTGVHKPLFEQLRANKEQEEAEREEYQKALMRGTLALDEEDVAHLEGLQRQRKKQEDEVYRRTEEELAAYRAARADRSQESQETKRSEDISINVSPTAEKSQTTAKPKLAAPQIMIKRKRRKDGSDQTGTDKKPKPAEEQSCKLTEEKYSTKEPHATAEEKGTKASLGSLLTGYGSSSDED